VNRRNSPPWGDQYPELNDCHLRRGGGAGRGAPTDVPPPASPPDAGKTPLWGSPHLTGPRDTITGGRPLTTLLSSKGRDSKPSCSFHRGSKTVTPQASPQSFRTPPHSDSRVYWSSTPTAPSLPPPLFTEEGSPGGPRSSPSTRLLQRRRSCAPRTGLRPAVTCRPNGPLNHLPTQRAGGGSVY